MRRHVIPDTLPWLQGVNTDGVDITLASMFYITAPATTWQCTGGRVHIPNDPTLFGVDAQLYAWTTEVGQPPVELLDPPLRTITTVTPLSAGWLEVAWTPFDVIAGQTLVAIGYKFLGADNIYLFTGSSQVGTDPFQAADGSPAWLAETTMDGGRSRFIQEGMGSTGTSTAWYGTDIILDDGVRGLDATWVDGAGVPVSGELHVGPADGGRAVPVIDMEKT